MKKATLTFSLVGGLGSQLHKYLLAEALSIELNADPFYELSYFYGSSRKIENSDPTNRLTRGFDLGNLCPELKEASPEVLVKCRGNLFHNIITRWPRLLGHIRAPYVTGALNLTKFATKRHLEYYDLMHGKPAPRSISKLSGSFFYFYGEPGVNLGLIEAHRKVLLKKINTEGWLSPKAKDLSNRISSDQRSVFLHVRRGDQPTSDRLPIGYYKSAISKIQHRIKSPFFYIFTDDRNWVGDHIFPLTFPNGSIIEGLNVDEDFVAMSKCRHGVLANSGFSFMASWLGRKADSIYILPRKWWANSSWNDIHLAEMPDYLEIIES